MRVLWFCVLVVGCVDGAAEDSQRGVDGDAARLDVASVEDTALPRDTGVNDTEASAADTSTPPAETSTCKTDCKGNECGNIPDGCGGFKNCGDCGEPGVWCEVMTTPLHREAVRAAIATVKTAHPEYFDFADSLGGESVKVLDAVNYRTAVVAEVNTKAGKVCIADPNDGREVRVRASTSTAAENYLTVTSGGYSAYKYTSTCTPAGF